MEDFTDVLYVFIQNYFDKCVDEQTKVSLLCTNSSIFVHCYPRFLNETDWDNKTIPMSTTFNSSLHTYWSKVPEKLRLHQTVLAEVQQGRIDRIPYLIKLGMKTMNEKIPNAKLLRSIFFPFTSRTRAPKKRNKKYFKTTLLHTAAHLGHTEIVQLLLSLGANPHIKISFPHPSVVNNSLNTSKTASNVQWYGRIPLDLAAMGGHRDVVQLLINWNTSHFPGLFPEHFVDFIMEKGEKVDKAGTLLLSVVEEGGPIEMIDYLVTMGEAKEGVAKAGWRAIHVAANLGNIEMVKKLMSLGVSLELEAAQCTPFYIAAEKGNLEMMKTLLASTNEESISELLNCTPENSDAPLHLAAQYGHLDLVKLLLSSGASVHKLGEASKSPLHYAAQRGHFEVVKVLLDTNKDIISEPMRAGNTALHLAITYKHFQIAIFLIENGANPDTCNLDGDYPINLAVMQGQKEIVTLLLGFSVVSERLDDGNSENWTPLMYACHKGNLEIVEMLIPKSNVETKMARNGYTALTWAIIGGHEKITEYLIEKGADINYTDNNENSVFHHAVESGNETVVKLLISKLVDVSVGKSPLEPAVEHGIRMVQLLLDYGVLPSNPKALMRAIETKQEDVAALLLSRGADPGVRKEYTHTSGLVMAIYHNLSGLVKMLVERGAEVTEHILHYAVHLGNPDIVDTLLAEFGSLSKEGDKDYFIAYFRPFFSAAIMDTLTKCICEGCSMLHCAVVKGSYRIVNSLLDKGALVNFQNIQQSTPLQLAVASRRVDIIQLLIDGGAQTEITDSSSLTPLLRAILETSEPPTLPLYHTNTLYPPSTVSQPTGAAAAMDISPQSLPYPVSRASIVRALVSNRANVNHQVSYQYPLLNSSPLVFPMPPALSNMPPPYTNSFFPSSIFTCTPLEHILWHRWATCSSKHEVDWKIVRELLKGDLNKHGHVLGGDTLLHQAVLMLDLKAIEILVEGGFDVNEVNLKGRTPLQLGEDFVSKCKEQFFLGTQHVETEFEKVKVLLNSKGTIVPTQAFWPPLPFVRFATSLSVAHQRKDCPTISLKKRKGVE